MNCNPCSLTPEQRKLGLKKSIESRRRNRAELQAYRDAAAKALLNPPTTLPQALPLLPPQVDQDPVGLRLARTLEEKLNLLDAATDPREIAQLARAIREVRETYHLVTGQPRPGLSRDDRKPSGLWAVKPAPKPSTP